MHSNAAFAVFKTADSRSRLQISNSEKTTEMT
jgi:hypothetical protein